MLLRSLLLNIPKFLEARLDTVSLGPDGDTNTTRLEVIYNVTSLRLNPDYMYYYIHWTRSQYPISVSIQIKMSNILLFLMFPQNDFQKTILFSGCCSPASFPSSSCL